MRRTLALLALSSMAWSQAAALHCAITMSAAGPGALAEAPRADHAGHGAAPDMAGRHGAGHEGTAASGATPHSANETLGTPARHGSHSQPSGCQEMRPCGAAMLVAVASQSPGETAPVVAKAPRHPSQAMIAALSATEPPPPRGSV